MTLVTDQPPVEVSVVIAAPVNEVWDLVTDINLPARFQSEFIGAEWLDDGPALEARFVGKNVYKGREWETTSWIVEYEPLSAFGWAVSDRHKPGAIWTFYLAESESGTKLTYHRSFGPGASGLTSLIKRYPDRADEFIAVRDEEHRTNMQSVINGIKKSLEASNNS